ncbi:MAG: restriction endonuclease subunit S [Paenibacillus sp.]|uniref:restriction endonuclease subunit S n=1 Tax=Paenibacillus aquistagni TaxID=1852522 RepID=UPI000B507258|nr:restriction endonuclease subunit S [Paenibacillus aquistagni]MBR2570372.1 restriction endonuclease subunit S [Paenibacillus sp.]
MSREHAYTTMLEAMAKMQWNVAQILEAKALEAEKNRNWVLNHLNQQAFATHLEQLNEPMEIHEQVIEVLEGLAKLQYSLARNMNVLLVEPSRNDYSGSADDSEDGEGYSS